MTRTRSRVKGTYDNHDIVLMAYDTTLSAKCDLLVTGISSSDSILRDPSLAASTHTPNQVPGKRIRRTSPHLIRTHLLKLRSNIARIITLIPLGNGIKVVGEESVGS